MHYIIGTAFRIPTQQEQQVRPQGIVSSVGQGSTVANVAREWVDFEPGHTYTLYNIQKVDEGVQYVFSSQTGAQQVVNQLENIVTEVESFYSKTRDKIQKIYDSMDTIENDEGLKVGVFIGPAIENAFMQDLRPVTKKGFTKDLQLPKAKRLDPEIVAQARAAGEIEEEPKSTVFTPNI